MWQNLRVDNMSTVAKINKMGTQVKSVARGKSTAVGLLSIEEDHAYSRTLARALESGGGQAVSNIQGLQEMAADAWCVQTARKSVGTVQVDWLAGGLNAYVRRFLSWKPDPEAWQVDTITVPWHEELGYTFPPFCLSGSCLAKVQQVK